jgi:general secretion pathway protein J
MKPSTVMTRQSGFTLIEVLIAMAITAFVATIAYTGLSAAISGVESTRAVASRNYELNRAMMIVTRDLRQFVARPIRDEFGETEPAMSGGELARATLSFTRAGWHNPNGLSRSQLQRVAYRVEDETLWRDAWSVLDRAGDSEPSSVRLLDGVEYLEVAFLGDLSELEMSNDGRALDTRNWRPNWGGVDYQQSNASGVAPPIAVELRLQLNDMGEVRRLYALPPI